MNLLPSEISLLWLQFGYFVYNKYLKSNDICLKSSSSYHIVFAIRRSVITDWKNIERRYLAIRLVSHLHVGRSFAMATQTRITILEAATWNGQIFNQNIRKIKILIVTNVLLRKNTKQLLSALLLWPTIVCVYVCFASNTSYYIVWVEVYCTY